MFDYLSETDTIKEDKMICPNCDGQRGWTVRRESLSSFPSYEWFQCETCNGTGFIDFFEFQYIYDSNSSSIK